MSTSGKLRNFWRYSGELFVRGNRFDDREVGDGTALQRDGGLGSDLSFSTDATKLVSFSLHGRMIRLLDGTRFSGDAGALFRVLPRLDIEILPTITSNNGEPRYVGAGVVSGNYLFGKLDAKSIGTTIRATYTFVPRLTLQAYAQMFLASGHYDEFSQYQSDPAGPRAVVRLSSLLPSPPPASNPDFAQGVLNVNIVFRRRYLGRETVGPWTSARCDARLRPTWCY